MSVTMSTETKDLFAAIARAQLRMRPAAKDKVNPHFKNSYADLASMWQACAGPLNEEGCAVLQFPERVPEGIAITTVLTHSSGQWIQSTLVMPLDQRANAQSVGSAITYGKRYSLPAVSDEDDDGNEASKSPPKQSAKQSKPASKKSEPKQQTGNRSEANKAARQAYAKYVITAQKNGHPMRTIAEFIAEATGKAVEEVDANESKWDQIPDRVWEKVCSAAIEAFALASEPAREPGEDYGGTDDELEGAA